MKETKSNYQRLLDECRCWRAFKDCPLGRLFLEQLYSWSELNPLDPWLVWKICDPCEFKGEPPWGAKMEERTEALIRMFRKSLFKAFYNWLEVNKEAIGEKWYSQLRGQAVKADANTPIKIMAASMWMFSMISNFGVLTGMGPPPMKIELQGFNEKLDRKSTMRLLLMIQSCMALQYFPKEIATAEIPVITAKKFSLKLFVEEQT